MYADQDPPRPPTHHQAPTRAPQFLGNSGISPSRSGRSRTLEITRVTNTYHKHLHKHLTPMHVPQNWPYLLQISYTFRPPVDMLGPDMLGALQWHQMFSRYVLLKMATWRACCGVPCQDVVAVRSTSGRTFLFHFQAPRAQVFPSRCIQARLLWSCL